MTGTISKYCTLILFSLLVSDSNSVKSTSSLLSHKSLLTDQLVNVYIYTSILQSFGSINNYYSYLPIHLPCTHNSKKLNMLNPNSIRSYKIVQKLSPKHAARGVAQSPYPIYRHGKASLSEQPPWHAAGDPRLARGRSRVRAPGPAGALHALFFSTLSSFLLWEIVFSHLPHPTHG